MPLFVYSQKIYSANDIYNIFSPKLSPDGSNRHEREEAVINKTFKVCISFIGGYGPGQTRALPGLKFSTGIMMSS